MAWIKGFTQMATWIKRWRGRTGGKRSSVTNHMHPHHQNHTPLNKSGLSNSYIANVHIASYQIKAFNHQHTTDNKEIESAKVIFSYLLICPVLWLEITAGLLKFEVEVWESVEQVHPPRWRVAHHRCHGEWLNVNERRSADNKQRWFKTVWNRQGSPPPHKAFLPICVRDESTRNKTETKQNNHYYCARAPEASLLWKHKTHLFKKV